ncbi:hypothetical protein [Lysinibacillus sp. NPDC047702]|uniref:hypothetical protein n=1 Tax=unclassified Lysinibacillus TaxID=2636778 RepID=UPI003D068798
MRYSKNELYTVPPYINLLFNNNQLELLKTLCLLFALSVESKKKFNKVSDLIFYYGLVHFDMLKILKGDEDDLVISRNRYFRYRQNINQIILELFNLDFIEIKGTIEVKTSDIGIRLNKKGLIFFQELNNSYFSELVEKSLSVISMIDNNSTNKSILEGGKK